MRWHRRLVAIPQFTTCSPRPGLVVELPTLVGRGRRPDPPHPCGVTERARRDRRVVRGADRRLRTLLIDVIALLIDVIEGAHGLADRAWGIPGVEFFAFGRTARGNRVSPGGPSRVPSEPCPPASPARPARAARTRGRRTGCG